MKVKRQDFKLDATPIDYVAKQLQSKRFHVKRQGNKKAYKRARGKQDLRSLCY